MSTDPAAAAAAVVAPQVVGWNVFYNNGAFDGNDPAASAADDAAIDPGKRPLLAGQTPTPANFTNYSRGINGIMIDVSGGLSLPALGILAASLTLRMGPGGDPAIWAPAPPPSIVGIRRGAGAGGSDRVTLIWPDGALANTWLQLTVRAQPETGLDRDRVYYFGNLVGDTADSATTFRVNAVDLGRVRRALNSTATVTSPFDVNHDGRVTALDLAVVRQNLNRTLAPPISSGG